MPPQVGQPYNGGTITKVTRRSDGSYRIQYSIPDGTRNGNLQYATVTQRDVAASAAPNVQTGPEGRAPSQPPAPLPQEPQPIQTVRSLAGLPAPTARNNPMPYGPLTPEPPLAVNPAPPTPAGARAGEGVNNDSASGTTRPTPAASAARTGPPPAAPATARQSAPAAPRSNPAPAVAAAPPPPPPFDPGPLIVAWNPATNQYDQWNGNGWTPTSYTIDVLNQMVADGRDVQEDRTAADQFDALPLDQQDQIRSTWTWHNGQPSNPTGLPAQPVAQQPPANPDAIVSTAQQSAPTGGFPDGVVPQAFFDNLQGESRGSTYGRGMANSQGTQDAERVVGGPLGSEAFNPPTAAATEKRVGPPSDTPMGQDAWNAAMGWDSSGMELDEYGQWRKKRVQQAGGSAVASPQAPGEGPITQHMAHGGRMGPPPQMGMESEPNAIVGEGLDSEPLPDDGSGNPFRMELIFIKRPDGGQEILWSEGPTSMSLPEGAVIVPIEETSAAVKAIKEQFAKAPGEPLTARLDGSFQGKESGQMFRKGGKARAMNQGGRVGPPPRTQAGYGEHTSWQGVGMPTFGNANDIGGWNKAQQQRFDVLAANQGDMGGFQAYQQRLQGLAPAQMAGSQSVYA